MSTRIDSFLCALLILGSACVLGWLLWYSRYGIDFTDESFYLVWIANPFIYAASATQFGFIYHPLHHMLGGDIAALRQANILITFGLAWILAKELTGTVFGESVTGKWKVFAISTGMAPIALTFCFSWLPTPSYNSLALQALLLAAIGLLYTARKPAPTDTSGWIIVGVAGWLTFMAKPTTSLALGAAICLFALSAKQGVKKPLISALTATLLVLASGLIIDGSIHRFIDRLKTGVEFATYLGGGHTFSQLLRLDNFQLGIRDKVLLVATTAIVVVSANLLQANKKIAFAGAILVSLFLGYILATVLGATHRIVHVQQFQGLFLLFSPVAAILLIANWWERSGSAKFSLQQIVLFFLFLAFPHIYAFGTNGNYWQAGGEAGYFWFFAGLLLLGSVKTKLKIFNVLAVFLIAAEAMVTMVLASGMDVPYRQSQPLRQNDYVVKIGTSQSQLVLSQEFGRYLNEAAISARKAGFVTGTPVVDLTGQSPGILYAIGAENIGQAWTIGGYPGSERLAIAALKKVSCTELSKAWILIEENGPRSLSKDVLTNFGANLSSDYRIAASWQTAPGAGGYEKSRRQILVRPGRSAENALHACETTVKG